MSWLDCWKRAFPTPLGPQNVVVIVVVVIVLYLGRARIHMWSWVVFLKHDYHTQREFYKEAEELSLENGPKWIIKERIFEKAKMVNEDLKFSVKWHIQTLSALLEKNTESLNSGCF